MYHWSKARQLPMLILHCVSFRSWDLEKQVKQLRTYRDLYQVLNKWIFDARRRQDAIETMKLSDVSTVMRYLQEQKVLFVGGNIKAKSTNL